MGTESWRSFSKFLWLKKRGRLPPFIERISLPGYWKERDPGRRIERNFIKNERYFLRPALSIKKLKIWFVTMYEKGGHLYLILISGDKLLIASSLQDLPIQLLAALPCIYG